jgi:hypothetical protein
MAELDGSWDLVWRNWSAVLTIRRSGDTFTGSFVHLGRTSEITDGRIEREDIPLRTDLTWTVEIEVPEDSLDCKATLEPSGSLSGHITGRYDSGPMTARRHL